MRIGGFCRFSLSDFPGRTAAVIFTRGCNYNCSYCHNRQLINAEEKSCSDGLDEVLAYLRRHRDWLDGLVITGGEPCLQARLVPFVQRVRSLGLAVKLDTNGSRIDALKTLLEQHLLDYVAMDIKAPFEKYDRVAGCEADGQTVKQSAQMLLRSGIPCEFRTTVAPDLLGEGDLLEIGDFVSGRAPLYLQALKGDCSPKRDAMNLHGIARGIKRRYGNCHVR